MSQRSRAKQQQRALKRMRDKNERPFVSFTMLENGAIAEQVRVHPSKVGPFIRSMKAIMQQLANAGDEWQFKERERLKKLGVDAPAQKKPRSTQSKTHTVTSDIPGNEVER